MKYAYVVSMGEECEGFSIVDVFDSPLKAMLKVNDLIKSGGWRHITTYFPMRWENGSQILEIGRHEIK
jgi:hypothetical protein